MSTYLREIPGLVAVKGKTRGRDCRGAKVWDATFYVRFYVQVLVIGSPRSIFCPMDFPETAIHYVEVRVGNSKCDRLIKGSSLVHIQVKV